MTPSGQTSTCLERWLNTVLDKIYLFIYLFYLFTNFAKNNLAGEISQNYCFNNETPKHAKKNKQTKKKTKKKQKKPEKTRNEEKTVN